MLGYVLTEGWNDGMHKYHCAYVQCCHMPACRMHVRPEEGVGPADELLDDDTYDDQVDEPDVYIESDIADLAGGLETDGESAMENLFNMMIEDFFNHEVKEDAIGLVSNGGASAVSGAVGVDMGTGEVLVPVKDGGAEDELLQLIAAHDGDLDLVEGLIRSLQEDPLEPAATATATASLKAVGSIEAHEAHSDLDEVEQLLAELNGSTDDPEVVLIEDTLPFDGSQVLPDVAAEVAGGQELHDAATRGCMFGILCKWYFL